MQVGDHVEVLNEGDSIYYDRSTPHGMIAVDGADCTFLAVVLPGEPTAEQEHRATPSCPPASHEHAALSRNSSTPRRTKTALLKKIDFTNEDTFNFAFDIVDAAGRRHIPIKLAMLHLDRDKDERRFTFRDMKLSLRPGRQLF